jgi:predicted acyltransferase
MDQFRGFTIVGMILVNFLSEFDWFNNNYPVLKHHNTYFSFADTIMPSFHFAVGFAFRLVLLRRIAGVGKTQAYYQAIRRNLGLIVVSMVISLSSGRFASWEKMESEGWRSILASFFKCDFWETLAIIGVTSLWVLPVIGRSKQVRLLFLLLSLGAHALLCHWFNFKFMYNQPCALDSLWVKNDTNGLDGGPFGFLAWAVPQLVGSMAYDVVTNQNPSKAFANLIGWGCLLAALGYGLSCISTLYPHAEPPSTDEGSIAVADSPVTPPNPNWQKVDIQENLAEPPFVQPSKEKQRVLNYWLMGKRVVTMPFILCSTGYALSVFGLFVLLCDVLPLSLGLLRTFGQNPLATYIIHERVSSAVRAFSPHDAPRQWALGSFFVYFAITYLFVRYLEKNRIYLRM